MPTQPKRATSYLVPDTYKALQRYQKVNKFASPGSAIAAILTAYFSQDDRPQLFTKVNELKQQSAAFHERLILLESAMSKTAVRRAKSAQSPVSNPKTKKGKSAIKKSKSVSAKAAATGLNQTQLCRKFSIDAKNVKRKARNEGMTTQEYLESETGWRLRDGKYYAAG